MDGQWDDSPDRRCDAPEGLIENSHYFFVERNLIEMLMETHNMTQW